MNIILSPMLADLSALTLLFFGFLGVVALVFLILIFNFFGVCHKPLINRRQSFIFCIENHNTYITLSLQFPDKIPAYKSFTARY